MPRVSRCLSISEIKTKSKTVGCHSVGGVPGLCLRVVKIKDGLTRYWLLRKQGQRGFKMHIGPYPEMPLKTAREEAAKLLLQHSAGLNPLVEREKQNEEDGKQLRAEQHQQTIRDVYNDYLDWKEYRGVWKNPADSRHKAQRRLECNFLPAGGHIVVATATPDEIAKAIEPIWCEKAPSADKVLPLVRELFAWAAAVAKIRSPELVNPAASKVINPLLPAQRMRKQTEHYPFLAPDQFPPFMKALHAKNTTTAKCTEFSILTCSRSQNARFATWDQIDFENRLWIIDKDEMKVSSNGQHIVPLSDQAISILKEMQEISRLLGNTRHIFVSTRKMTDTPLAKSALNQVIDRLHVEAVRRGEEGWIDREQTKASGTERVAVQHAIARSTFETWGHSLRKDPRTIDLCLHHNVDQHLRSAYDRDDSIEHKRVLLQEWADFAYSMIEQ